MHFHLAFISSYGKRIGHSTVIQKQCVCGRMYFRLSPLSEIKLQYIHVGCNTYLPILLFLIAHKMKQLLNWEEIKTEQDIKARYA